MDMCGMMLIDMHGVRYANNLLKNPATKHLSGKNKGRFPYKNISFGVPRNINSFRAESLRQCRQGSPQHGTSHLGPEG